MSNTSVEDPEGWLSAESLNVEDSKSSYFGPPKALFIIMYWLSVSDLAPFWLSLWRTTVHLGGKGGRIRRCLITLYPLRRQNAGRQEDQVINRNVHCHDKIPTMSLYHLRYQNNDATSWGPNVLMHEPRGQLKFKTENCPFSCTWVEHTMSLPFPGNSLLSLSDCIFCVRPEPWVLSPQWRLY